MSETIKYGDGSGDVFLPLKSRPDRELRIEQGEQARLITAATSNAPVDLGRLFQEGDEWVYEDPTGVQTRFIPGTDVEDPRAAWTLLKPECVDPEPVIADLYNSDPYRRSQLSYGTPVNEVALALPRDWNPFGRKNMVIPNGLTDLTISTTHFGVGLERDGAAFVTDAGSTNGTWVAVRPNGETFAALGNRIVRIK